MDCISTFLLHAREVSNAPYGSLKVISILRIFCCAIHDIQATMSPTMLSNPGNQETELTASTRRNMFSSLILIFALTALLLYVFVERVDTKRVGSNTKAFDCADIKLKAETLFEQSHRCGSPRLLQYRWPLALDIVIDAFRIHEEKQVLNWFVRLFEETGPTFQQNILASKSINTIEPENIETILSTNFSGKTFGLSIRVEDYAD